ncbi:MAG: hypothetical protein IJ615_01050 [Bacteroidaceae bacterium]|nr:hypothetical protein [Bacteroidaceae bacterium]
MIDKELIHQAAEDIDIFEADLTEEFERLAAPPRRTVRLWPLVAAACAAGIVAVLLMPPKAPSPEEEGSSAAESLPLRGDNWRGAVSLEAQLAHQQEIKEKGERLAAYVRKYTTTNKQ